MIVEISRKVVMVGMAEGGVVVGEEEEGVVVGEEERGVVVGMAEGGVEEIDASRVLFLLLAPKLSPPITAETCLASTCLRR